MKYFPYADLRWSDTPLPGITKSEVIRDASGGGVAYWHVPKGSGFDRHAHKGYEYTVLISGKMKYLDVVLNEGDFLITSEGEEHEATALQDSVILVINERSNA